MAIVPVPNRKPMPPPSQDRVRIERIEKLLEEIRDLLKQAADKGK